jgi:CTP:molybdopterin cytidylyltransferase MocA
VALILTAGASTRLGANKALLTYGGKSLVQRVADACLQSKVGQTVVVVGACAEEVESEIAALPVEVVLNSQYLLGRTGSIKCGLQAVAKLSNTALLLFPVDCPFVSASIVNSLVDRLHIELSLKKRNLWIAPECKGRGGHPALLYGGLLLRRIANLDNDYSLRQFLQDEVNSGKLYKVRLAVDSPAVLDNLNSSFEVSRSFRRQLRSPDRSSLLEV